MMLVLRNGCTFKCLPRSRTAFAISTSVLGLPRVGSQECHLACSPFASTTFRSKSVPFKSSTSEFNSDSVISSCIICCGLFDCEVTTGSMRPCRTSIFISA